MKEKVRGKGRGQLNVQVGGQGRRQMKGTGEVTGERDRYGES